MICLKRSKKCIVDLAWKDAKMIVSCGFLIKESLPLCVLVFLLCVLVLLNVTRRPFDPELYEDEGEDDDVLDEEGRARLKLKVENNCWV